MILDMLLIILKSRLFLDETKYSFHEALQYTIAWYIDNEKWYKNIW